MAYKKFVYNEQIQALFRPGQGVASTAKFVGKKAENIANDIAPRRGKWKSEHLSTKNYYSGYLHAGPMYGQISVGNKASYARYVSQGTRFFAMPMGRYMVFPAGELHGYSERANKQFARFPGIKIRKGLGKRAILQHRRGQTANHWLENAVMGATLQVLRSRNPFGKF